MSGQIQQASHLLQPQPQKSELSLIDSRSQQVIDPIKQLLLNNNALPILAVLQRFDINADIEPGTPLLNLLVNKYLPLDIIMKDREVQFRIDTHGKTPLHLAVEADDAKAVYWCLKHDHKSIKDGQGYTPIMQAIKLGFRRCFLLCLQFKQYDNQIAHVAAAFNRVWQLQVMQTLNIQFANNHDSHHRTPLDVAVENYSYQAAEELIKLYPQLNIDKLQNLTDSIAIIRRMKRTRTNNTALVKIYWPLVKFLSCFIFTFVGIYQSFLFNNTYFYVAILIFIAFLYITIVLVDMCSPQVKKKQQKRIIDLLKAPDFPTMAQICPKCLQFSNPQYDHCDQLGCCVKRFHFYDFLSVNYSNQHLWAIVEYVWLVLVYIMLVHLISYSITKETNPQISVPIIIQPLRTIQKYYLIGDYTHMLFTIWLIIFFLQQTFICLEVLGIMFMGRTYQEVNHTQKYRHLYRIVKLRDGTYRNKQIRVFEEGFCKGLGKGIKNIGKFMFGWD